MAVIFPIFLSIGVGFAQRKIGCATKPSQEITVNGDCIHIKISSFVNTSELSFKLDEEFDEMTGDGRNCKVEYKKIHAWS